jgi:hypothetical protein
MIYWPFINQCARQKLPCGARGQALHVVTPELANKARAVCVLMRQSLRLTLGPDASQTHTTLKIKKRSPVYQGGRETSRWLVEVIYYTALYNKVICVFAPVLFARRRREPFSI